MVSAEALAIVNVRVITKPYIDQKEEQIPAFNCLEIKSNQLLKYDNGPFDLLIGLNFLF